MYSSLQLAFKYLNYYRTASNSKGHGMHSPFVFDFILHVLNNSSGYKAPEEVEQLRQCLKKDSTMLTLDDMGAGSRISSSSQKKIKQLAKAAVKPKKYGQVLFRLVNHYETKTVIELGTSLGITTAYLAKANPAATVITVEGSHEIHKVANHTFSQLQLNNITSLNGNFDTILPAVLSKLTAVDLAYIDGNHRFEPTLNYFNQFLSKANNNTILVFDDIHWSAEMEKAWEVIRQHPSVRCTIDIFFLGFVFLRKEFKEKQHFAIRF